MPTPSCLEVPQCTQVLLIVCRRKSPLWLHRPLRSRSLLHLSVNTLSGSEDPFLHRSQPSNRCGFQNKNTTSPAQASSTGSVSKHLKQHLQSNNNNYTYYYNNYTEQQLNSKCKKNCTHSQRTSCTLRLIVNLTSSSSLTIMIIVIL